MLGYCRVIVDYIMKMQ